MYCKGVTERKKQCRNKSLKNTEYCRYHANQNNDSRSEVVFAKQLPPSQDMPNNKNEANLLEKCTGFECFICCETVDEKRKCELVCGHDFCVTCVKKWKTDCPVCRKPIVFKKKDVELSKTIKNNELKCKRDATREQINADAQYSTNLVVEDRNIINNRRPIGTQPISNAQRPRNIVNVTIPSWIISESITYGEINDYNLEIAIIEESILQNESYEDKLIEEILHVSMTTLTPEQLKKIEHKK
jgi:hypothetical protein